MSLEENLSSIDTTLKQILQIMITGAAVPAVLGEPEKKAATGSKKGAGGPKPTSEAAGAVLEGDPEGTKYWMSHDKADFYKTAPGAEKPPVENINNVSAAYYAAHKNQSDEAKKSKGAGKQQSAADTALSATAQQGDASVPFKTVVERLTVLSKDPKEGRGREGVMAILNKHLADLPEAERKVPKLELLKKNAEILADVEAALSDTVVEAAEFDPFA